MLSTLNSAAIAAADAARATLTPALDMTSGQDNAQFIQVQNRTTYNPVTDRAYRQSIRTEAGYRDLLNQMFTLNTRGEMVYGPVYREAIHQNTEILFQRASGIFAVNDSNRDRVHSAAAVTAELITRNEMARQTQAIVAEIELQGAFGHSTEVDDAAKQRLFSLIDGARGEAFAARGRALGAAESLDDLLEAHDMPRRPATPVRQPSSYEPPAELFELTPTRLEGFVPGRNSALIAA